MLEEFRLFEDLSEAELAQIRGHAVTRTFPKNTVIVTEGDDTTSLYLIESGKVKFFLSEEDGREVILNIQGAGYYFGELALLDNSPRSVSVMTVEPTSLLVVSRDDFFECLRGNPEICLKLLAHLAGRLRELSDEVRSLALTDVYSRVTRLLERQAEEREGERIVPERMTHQQISQMVGSSREMVSRIMKELVAGGYLSVDKDGIRLLKPFPKGW